MGRRLGPGSRQPAAVPGGDHAGIGGAARASRRVGLPGVRVSRLCPGGFPPRCRRPTHDPRAEPHPRSRPPRRPDTDYCWVLAERAGGLVGFACYGPVPMTQGTFDLYWIAVSPEARGTDVAKRL